MIVPAPAVQASVSGTRHLWGKLKRPLLLACGLLIFVSVSSICLVISSQSNRELMNRALDLDNKLWGILAVVRVAESEQRGYLLTGDPKYLEVFHTTADSGLRAVAAVREAIVDNPAHQLALTEIEPLVVRKFAEVGKPFGYMTPATMSRPWPSFEQAKVANSRQKSAVRRSV